MRHREKGGVVENVESATARFIASTLRMLSADSRESGSDSTTPSAPIGASQIHVVPRFGARDWKLLGG